jgi:hypothetical protein
MKRGVLVASFVVGVFAARAVFATDQSSLNYQNLDSTFAPAVFSSQSSNFQINGSVEAIVGAGASVGFSIQSGVPVQLPTAVTVTPTPTPTPSTGGSGGGQGSASGIGFVVPPTLLFRTPTFRSHQLIYGTRGSSDTVISVNGSSIGVRYPSSNTWERDIPLFLGRNTIEVQGSIPSGYVTPIVVGEIERMLIGDVNRSHRVDDVDLSLFVRAWKTYTPFADFNEDGLINDIDLSLLVSHWGMFF